MNFSYYIAKRYLFTKSTNNAINIITLIAAIGVFAGALALFIVLSGFSGLKEFSLSFTNEFDPDLKVLPQSGKVIHISEKQKKALENMSDVKAYSEEIEERVLLNFKNKSTPAFIKGIDENYHRVNNLEDAVIAGTWLNQNENQVVVGSGISLNLGLGVMDHSAALQLMAPRPGKGQITDPREAFKTMQTMASGIYSINEELDNKYVFVPFKMARNLLELKKNEVSALEIKLAQDVSEKKVKAALTELFNDEVLVKNRIQLNDKLYKMLNTENLAVYLIFTLVLIIALFNVGGSIVMSILDKQTNIITFYNLGARVSTVQRIFFLQGTLLTFVGGMAGLLVGFIIIWLQLQFNLVMITATLAYPVLLRIENVGIVFATIMVLGITASYIGSTRVSKVLKS